MQKAEAEGHLFREKLAWAGDLGNLMTLLKALVIVSSILLFYGQDMGTIFVGAVQNEAANYVFLVPVIFAYFTYRKRKMLRAVVASEVSTEKSGFLAPLSGVLLCTTAITLYWYAANTFSPLEYRVLTLPLFAAGLVLVLFGVQTLRQLAFPIFFLVLLVPPPLQVLNNIGSALSVAGSEISARVVSAVGVPAEVFSSYGNPVIMITRPDKTVLGFTLDLACSGIYPLIGFLVFAFFMAYITRGAPWKKAVIFIVGLPLIFTLNIVRLTSILLIGFGLGQDLALQLFHLLGGLVLVALSIALLFAVMEKAFGPGIFRGAPPAQACTKCTSPENAHESFCIYCGKLLRNKKISVHKGDVVKMFSVAVLVAVLMGIQMPALAQSSRPLPVFVQTQDGQRGNTQILPEISGYNLSFLSRDTDFEKTAEQDAALTYAYEPDNRSQETLTVTVEMAQARSSLHNWEVCLVTWPQTHGGQSMTQLDLRDTKLLENPPMTGRFFAFQYPNYNETEVVLYWFDQSFFVMGNETKEEYVKISLISFLDNTNGVAEAEGALLVFGSEVSGYWQPIKTWTGLSLMISQNGATLALSTASLLVGTTVVGTVSKFSNEKVKARLYRKLSEEDRRFIDSVRQATQNPTSAPENTGPVNGETANREPDDRALLQRLVQAEGTGLISPNIINRSDEPFRTWAFNVRV